METYNHNLLVARSFNLETIFSIFFIFYQCPLVRRLSFKIKCGHKNTRHEFFLSLNRMSKMKEFHIKKNHI